MSDNLCTTQKMPKSMRRIKIKDNYMYKKYFNHMKQNVKKNIPSDY